MDHELKQRLIGAVVVTALCAIFIPMLFDDPVDTNISELAVPAPANTGAGDAGNLPASAEQVLKLPDSEPLTTDNSGETIESTGAEEELAEPDAGQSKQGGAGDALYAESKGYTRQNIDEEPPVDEPEVVSPKVHSKQPLDSAQGKSSLTEALKNQAPKAQVRDARMEAEVNEAVKAKKVIETLKPITVKKPDIEPSSNTHAEAVKSDALAVQAKQPSAAKSLAAAVAEAKKPVVAPPKAPAKLVRWFIQVGSFSKKDNAMSLWDSLREQGLPASLDTVQTDKGISYRLRVGPELDEKKAVAMKSRLDKQNIKAILISE